MPSSSRPYQSKVLRFVLRQWQQGLERQDKAWRQLQSTAVWGAQVAIFPIYAIMRSVKRASFTLSGGKATALNPPIEPIIAAKGNVTDLNHSLTAILSHTQQLLSPEQAGQLITAPKNNIFRKTQSLLSNTINQIEQRLPTSLQVFKRSGTILKTQRGHLTAHQQARRGNLSPTAASNSMGHRESSDLLQNGTTLASSLKTQKLVLVNPSNETFDIFTAEQQTDLKHYINCVMTAYRQSRTITRRQTKQLSVKTVLAIGAVFLKSLPGEFSKAWLQIAPGPQQTPILPTFTSHGPQPRTRVFYPHTNAVKARRLPARGSTRQLASHAPDAFEASINDSSYLEHPLEKILRLIDRVLTWCEHRWQQWIEGRANMG